MAHFFLKYHPTDIDFALWFAVGLKKAGFNLWVDKFDSGTAEQALEASFGIIVVVSPELVVNERDKSSLVMPDGPLYSILLRQDADLDLGEVLADFTGYPQEEVFQERLQSTVEILRARHGEQFSSPASTEVEYLLTTVARIEQYFADAELAYNRGKVVSGNIALCGGEDGEAASSVSDLLKVLEEHACFTLTGKSGSGKTTLLYQLGADSARHRLQNPGSGRLPLIIHFESWEDESTFLDLVRAFWRLDLEPEQMLGHTLFLLDGFEKIPPDKVLGFQRWVEDQDSQLSAVISHHESVDPNLPWPQVTVSIEKRQIQTLVNHFLEEEAELLLQRIFHSQLSSLVRDLNILRILISMGSHNALPKNLGMLYSTLTYMMLSRYLDSTEDSEYEEVEEALAPIAFNMIESGQFITHQMIEDSPYLAIVDQADLLVGAGDKIDFKHQFVKEYLAAIHLFNRGSEIIFNLIPEPSLHFLGREHSRWDNVIIVLSGLVQEPESFIQAVIGIDPFLAGKCLASGVDIPGELYEGLLEAFQAMLGSEAGPVQIASANVLGGIADSSAAPALLTALRKGSSAVASPSIDDLFKNIFDLDLAETEIGDVPELMDSLRQKNAFQGFVRQAIADALVSIGTASIPGLLNIAEDNEVDYNTGFIALMALQAIGDPIVVPKLLQLLRNGSPHGHLIATILRRLQGDATRAMLATLEEEDPQVRSAAIFGIMANDALDEDFAPILIEALDDEVEEVRMGAAVALTEIGASITPMLLDAFVPDSYRKREIILQILEHLGEPAVAFLLDALDTSDDPRRAFVAQALGRIGATSAIPALVENLYRGTMDEQLGASWALGALGAAGEKELREALKHEEVEVRMVALSGLGPMASPATIRRIAEVSRKGNIGERYQAIKALASIPHEEAIAGLAQALYDRESDIRKIAARSLASFGSNALQELMAVLRSDDTEARLAAATALQAIGEPAKEELVAVLNDPRGAVRLSARLALGSIEGNRSGRLREMIMDEGADSESRIIAVMLFTQEVGAQTLTVLLQAASDLDWELRLAALNAITTLDSSVTDDLVDIVQDTSQGTELKVAAASALLLMQSAGLVSPISNGHLSYQPEDKLLIRTISVIAMESVKRDLPRSLLEEAQSDANYFVSNIAQTDPIQEKWTQ